MRKKVIALYSISVLAIAGWLITKSIAKLKEKEQREVNVATLPDFAFSVVSGDLTSLSSIFGTSSITLILFNSECDHCQYEAGSISPYTAEYSDTRFVFLSEEPLGKIETFQKEFFGPMPPNVTFGRIDAELLYDTFGPVFYPNIFIYGKDGKLLKEFKGETKPEAIMTFLK